MISQTFNLNPGVFSITKSTKYLVISSKVLNVELEDSESKYGINLDSSMIGDA